MPANLTYPGVYIEEMKSGVRTIMGVSTSTALFIGRTAQGPLNEPVRCLSYMDFERVFSSDSRYSELPISVRLFFQNGGTNCFVVRIAEGLDASSVKLKAESSTDSAPIEVLEVCAKSPGTLGDQLKVIVTYSGPNPESTFNLEIIRMGIDATGRAIKETLEEWRNLSMDPHDARYAVQFVNQNSRFVKLEDLINYVDDAKEVEKPLTESGYSVSGRPVPTQGFKDTMKEYFCGTASEHCKFKISVDGKPAVLVDFCDLDLDDPGPGTRQWLATEICSRINDKISPSIVTVEYVKGPTNESDASTVLLKISSSNGDVRIVPADDKDLAGPLMLGTDYGGIEVSRYAGRRPAANGLVLGALEYDSVDEIDGWMKFAGMPQTDLNAITIGSSSIDLGTDLVTVPSTGSTDSKMYQEKALETGQTLTKNNDGLREKLDIIVTAINKMREEDPDFNWSAEVWGSRLALIPLDGGPTTGWTPVSQPESLFGNLFKKNLRFYSLGGDDRGFQCGGHKGNDGDKPETETYEAAYKQVDKDVDIFNLLIIPRDIKHYDTDFRKIWGPASIYCKKRRAFLLMDPPHAWAEFSKITKKTDEFFVNKLRQGLVKDHSAIFYPRITLPVDGLNRDVGPSGAIAGLMARTDSERGVWKAPAGLDADVRGVIGLEKRLSNMENGVLNQRGINVLRVFPAGIVNWGARTMDGDDDLTSEWKYIPIRRLALYIEESLYRGTQWVVFEPNDEPLWAQIRLNLGAFMHRLFRQGAFQGISPKDAYFVKCDKETTTQDDINRGVVNIIVGFAPLKPAEFVVIKIVQIAGDIQT